VLQFASSLRLGPNIGLSISLFLLPVSLILVLLAGVQNKDIEFATKEVAGTPALAALHAIQAKADRALLAGAALVAGAAETAPAFPALGLTQEADALNLAFHDAGDAAG
jgi:hypothetical protein